ncbi:hypothetical protein ACFL6G_06430 [candidate division KSB1 bacterium]
MEISVIRTTRFNASLSETLWIFRVILTADSSFVWEYDLSAVTVTIIAVNKVKRRILPGGKLMHLPNIIGLKTDK